MFGAPILDLVGRLQARAASRSAKPETRWRREYSPGDLALVQSGLALTARAVNALLCCVAAVLVATASARVHAVDDDAARVLSAVVGLTAQIPSVARTAETLGTRRAGSGIVIDANGLVVTIGYLVLEASEVELKTDERTVHALVVGYDSDSGLGLVRATEPLDAVPMRLGDSTDLTEGSPVLIASFAEERSVTPAIVVARREFAGYWEYLLDDAIITSPPHVAFGGAALIDSSGELLGIGSLAIEESSAGQVLPANLFVPVDE